MAFKQAVITCDGQNVVALAADKGHRETVVVFNAKSGAPGPKIPLKVAGVKVLTHIVFGTNRLITQEKQAECVGFEIEGLNTLLFCFVGCNTNNDDRN